MNLRIGDDTHNKKIEKCMFAVQCVTDSQSYIEQEDGEAVPLDYLPDVAMEKLKVIREIALEREKTLNKILDFYLNLYQNLVNNQSA